MSEHDAVRTLHITSVPLTINLLSSSSTAAHPISISSAAHRPVAMNEKALDVDATPLSDFSDPGFRSPSVAQAVQQQRSPRSPAALSTKRPLSLSSHPPHRSPCPNSPTNHQPGHCSPLFLRQPTPIIIPNHHLVHSGSYTRPRGLRLANLIRPWIPVILYAMTSLGFLIAIAFWKTEVFTALDELSSWLRRDEDFGHAVLFCLIFLTTFPPIPLYSTLITLSGYTFGPWTGAIISYFAALSGALVVFLISRSLLRDTITRWLATTHTIRRVIRAIEKRPKLLFLIRVAPYPYNVMNCLLAAAPTLTLKTYTICTALSLFKVIIHTSLGASIHSFKDYHVAVPSTDGQIHPVDSDNSATRMWTIVGIILCVAIFIYLAIVARRAVDEELDDEVVPEQGRDDDEERIAFLSSQNHDWDERSMVESPFRSTHLLPLRPSSER